MSFNRLLTRWSVVCALNNYLAEPYPTLAGPNIFDSKIEPVEDMAQARAFPCCVVYTDYDEDPWGKAQKIETDRLLTVTLELLIVQATVQQGQSPPIYSLECPSTDSEIESTLDIFETQIYRALAAGTVASDAFNYLCPAYKKVISRRGASVEGGHKLAARQITLEMKSVRDNTKGIIPEPLAPFVDRLETFPDYQDRIAELRDVMTAPAAMTDEQQYMLTLGYSTQLMEALALKKDQAKVLPPNITFLNPNGGPM